MLPHGYQERAGLLTRNFLPLLGFYPLIINVLFVGSLFFAWHHRDLLKWMIPILVTLVLKLGMHAVIVSQARYYLLVIALEILAISLVSNTMFRKENWKTSLRSLLLGLVSVLILMMAMNYARGYIQTHDLVLRTELMVFSHTRGVVSLVNG